MQIRASSFQGDRPRCCVDPKHPIHRHGYYERYANCNDGLLERILRFLCVICGHTISVLGDHRLPYRPLPVPLLQAHLDAKARGGPEPPATEKEKGCLQRAFTRFKQRVEPLTAVLGQMISVVKPSAEALWNQLRRQGNLAAILLQLARPFNTSLLHDYQCLLPWSNWSD